MPWSHAAASAAIPTLSNIDFTMKPYFLIPLSLLVSQLAFSWGGKGHEIVVAVAERHLTENAKKNIAELIPYDLIQDASYMDKHRGDPDLAYAYNFHEQCIDLETLEYDPNAHVECGDLMRALWLSDYNLGHYHQVSDSIAQLNLRMLLHFTGELHCPVHIGIPSIWQPRPPFRQDKGKWYWNGKNVNTFHSFIDRSPAYLFPDADIHAIAASIDNVSRAQARQFVKGDFVDWTNDAARSGYRIYDYFPPLWEIPDTPEDKVIPTEYLDQIRDIITLELLKGGYQLAFLLNKYFDK